MDSTPSSGAQLPPVVSSHCSTSPAPSQKRKSPSYLVIPCGNGASCVLRQETGSRIRLTPKRILYDDLLCEKCSRVQCGRCKQQGHDCIAASKAGGELSLQYTTQDLIGEFDVRIYAKSGCQYGRLVLVVIFTFDLQRKLKFHLSNVLFSIDMVETGVNHVKKQLPRNITVEQQSEQQSEITSSLSQMAGNLAPETKKKLKEGFESIFAKYEVCDEEGDEDVDFYYFSRKKTKAFGKFCLMYTVCENEKGEEEICKEEDKDSVDNSEDDSDETLESFPKWMLCYQNHVTDKE
jgi:hypothetical protein